MSTSGSSRHRKAVHLVVCVATAEQARGLNLSLVDVVVAGYPYCSKFPGAINADASAIALLASTCQAQDVELRFRPTAMPFPAEFQEVVAQIGEAAEAGIRTIEVSDVGLFRHLRRERQDLRLLVGPLANVTTPDAAKVMGRLGAGGLVVSVESSLGDLQALSMVGLPIEVQVHGPMCLGLARRCLLSGANEASCDSSCQRLPRLEWELFGARCAGKAQMSGRDLCMVEHLDALLASGVTGLRVEAAFARPEAIMEVVGVYRKALTLAQTEGKQFRPSDPEWDSLRSENGVCNGFLFGQSGQLYFSGQHGDMGRSR